MSIGLPAPDEPLRLPDGRTVLPDGSVVKPTMVEVPTAQEAQRIVTRTKRKLADLPVKPQSANAISVVIAYSLMGLDEDEIAIATGLSVKQVGSLRMHPAFAEMQSHIVNTVLESDMDDVRKVLQQGAKKAARKLVSALDHEEPALWLRAADSVLDRSGHRPADIVEHRHSMQGGLLIEVVDRTSTGQQSIPSMTLPADEVEEHVVTDNSPSS